LFVGVVLPFDPFFFFTFRNRMQRNNHVRLSISAALPKLLYYKHVPSSVLHKICLITGVYDIFSISPSTVFLPKMHNYKPKSLMQEHTRPLTLPSIVNIAVGGGRKGKKNRCISPGDLHVQKLRKY